MQTTILKIQKPIYTSSKNYLWLYYNESRDIFFEREPTEKEIKEMGNEYKMYAKYTYKTLELIEKINNQNW